MGLFSGLRAPRAEAAPVEGFQILVFGPAMLQVASAGEDPGRALAALGRAVRLLDFPHGFTAERVQAVASEMARMIRVEGVAGITARIGAELSPRAKADAMRLALVAVRAQDRQGREARLADGIGRLAALAGQIGLPAEAFDALARETAAMAPACGGPSPDL